MQLIHREMTFDVLRQSMGFWAAHDDILAAAAAAAQSAGGQDSAFFTQAIQFVFGRPIDAGIQIFYKALFVGVRDAGFGIFQRCNQGAILCREIMVRLVFRFWSLTR